MSLRNDIENSDLYHSGQAFRPLEMARHLGGQDQRGVAEALGALRDNNSIAYDGIRYWKPKKHWINSMRLANPVVGV